MGQACAREKAEATQAAKIQAFEKKEAEGAAQRRQATAAMLREDASRRVMEQGREAERFAARKQAKQEVEAKRVTLLVRLQECP